MSQIFSRNSNKFSRFAFVGFLVLVIAGIAIAAELTQSPYMNGAGEAVDQPLPFSHQHHVQGLGLDCRFCHTSVETSSHANFPDTHTCMTCHSQIWTQAQILQPVRDSYQHHKPLEWIQVNQLPDHVYFDHSEHVHGGIGCVTCHGAISREPSVVQSQSFRMKDCLECHRHPENFIRPRSEIFNEDWKPKHQVKFGEELMNEYRTHPPPTTNCSECHR